MNEAVKRVMIILMMVIFTFAIMRVSSNSLLSAEEELIEHMAKAAKHKDNSIHFFDIFEGEPCFILVASKDCHFNKRNNSRLNYQDPLIDIPLMPPELKM